MPKKDCLYCLPCDEVACKETLSLNTIFEFVVGNLTRVPLEHCTGWRTMPFHHCTMRINASTGYSGKIEYSNRPTIFTHSRDMLFTRAEVTHRITDQKCGGPALSLWMHFRFRIMNCVDVFQFYDIPELIPEPQTARLQNLMTQLIEMPKELDFAGALQQQVIGSAFCAELLACGSIRHNLDAGFKSRFCRFQNVMRQLDESDSMPSLKAMAQSVNLSESRFRAVFREIAGISPVHYFEAARFRRGCRLLVQSDCSIGEIADRLGYCNLFHFSLDFRKHAGVSPTEFRTRHQENDVTK